MRSPFLHGHSMAHRKLMECLYIPRGLLVWWSVSQIKEFDHDTQIVRMISQDSRVLSSAYLVLLHVDLMKK